MSLPAKRQGKYGCSMFLKPFHFGLCLQVVFRAKLLIFFKKESSIVLEHVSLSIAIGLGKLRIPQEAKKEFESSKCMRTEFYAMSIMHLLNLKKVQKMTVLIEPAKHYHAGCFGQTIYETFCIITTK